MANAEAFSDRWTASTESFDAYPAFPCGPPWFILAAVAENVSPGRYLTCWLEMLLTEAAGAVLLGWLWLPKSSWRAAQGFF
jgi:hypothetical protein